MKKIFLPILIFSAFILLSLFVSSKSYASTVYSENFGGSSQHLESHNSDWINISSYYITDNSNIGSNSDTTGGHEANYYGTSISSPDLKYKISYKVDTSLANNVLYFILKTNNSLNTGYGIRFNYSSGADHMWIQDRNGGSFIHQYNNTISRSDGDWVDLEVDYQSGGFTFKINGSTVDTYTDTTYQSTTGKIGLVCLGCSVKNLEIDDYTTPATTISSNPTSGTVTVGTPFSVDVKVNNNQDVFNAARSAVTVSSNLTINSISNPSSNACNFSYNTTPTTSNPSFAGAIYNGSSTACTVYKMVLTPNTSGTGTVTFTNASVKKYSDSSEELTGVDNASFTINNPGATPTPTPTLSDVTVTSPDVTYNSSFTLSGTKDPSVTQVFVNDSDAGTTYPTSTTWEATIALSSGNNDFIVYGRDSGGHQTATINTSVNLHALGDINGDGVVDIVDASLFAVDWDKTSGLTYILSDMNGDGVVNLTDLSILARLEE